MFKYMIYCEDELVVDSQEKYGDEGLFSSDDVAWDMGNEEIFSIVNNVGSDDFDPDNIVEDERYRVEVEELD